MLFLHALLQLTAHNNPGTMHRKDESHVFQSVPSESADEFVGYIM